MTASGVTKPVDATSRFYQANKDRLYAYLLRLTGNHHLACDLVQESFVRYLGRYGDRPDSCPLLYTIARHAALDAIRRRHPETSDSVDRADGAGDPEQRVMDREALHRVLTALGQMESVDRELIALVATADLTYREIGTMLNLSEANVKVKVHRARIRLRAILGPGG